MIEFPLFDRNNHIVWRAIKLSIIYYQLKSVSTLSIGGSNQNRPLSSAEAFNAACIRLSLGRFASASPDSLYYQFRQILSITGQTFSGMLWPDCFLIIPLANRRLCFLTSETFCSTIRLISQYQSKPCKEVYDMRSPTVTSSNFIPLNENPNDSDLSGHDQRLAMIELLSA